MTVMKMATFLPLTFARFGLHVPTQSRLIIWNCFSYLRGGMGFSARERLPEGNHEFGFRFYLPSHPDMPTSFASVNGGTIRYTLIAELDTGIPFEAAALTTVFIKDVRVIGTPLDISSLRVRGAMQNFVQIFTVPYYIAQC